MKHLPAQGGDQDLLKQLDERELFTVEVTFPEAVPVGKRVRVTFANGRIGYGRVTESHGDRFKVLVDNLQAAPLTPSADLPAA